jgi:hypothetical protein
MARLQRSFKKEAGKWPTFYFDENQWQVLMQAYHSSSLLFCSCAFLITLEVEQPSKNDNTSTFPH